MIILDKPYISGFLLDTLERNSIPVIHNDVVSEYTEGRNLNLLSQEIIILNFIIPVRMQTFVETLSISI